MAMSLQGNILHIISITLGSTLPWQINVPTGSTPSGKQFAALTKLSLACTICGGTSHWQTRQYEGLCNVPRVHHELLYLPFPLSTQKPANTRSWDAISMGNSFIGHTWCTCWQHVVIASATSLYFP